MRIRSLLVGTSSAALLFTTPVLAQSVTTTSNHMTAGASASRGQVNTPAPVTVGQLLKVAVSYGSNQSTSIAVTDSAGNSATQEGNAAVSNNNTVAIFRIPVTTASNGADGIKVVLGANEPYPTIEVVQATAPDGYHFAGEDFNATTASGSGGTLNLSGTVTQANDFIYSATYNNASGVGSNQTILTQSGTGMLTSWNQANTLGAATHTYQLAGDTAGLITSEKVLPTLQPCTTVQPVNNSDGTFTITCGPAGKVTVTW